jgi:hypothetical protein
LEIVAAFAQTEAEDAPSCGRQVHVTFTWRFRASLIAQLRMYRASPLCSVGSRRPSHHAWATSECDTMSAQTCRSCTVQCGSGCSRSSVHKARSIRRHSFPAAISLALGEWKSRFFINLSSALMSTNAPALVIAHSDSSSGARSFSRAVSTGGQALK